MVMDEASLHRGGQRSAEMHSGTSLRRLRSRCVAPALSPLSTGVIVLGKHHLELPSCSTASEGGRVTFPVLLCLSIPAGSLPTRRLYRGRSQPETQDEIQGGEFAHSQLCKNETSLNKDCVSSQIWIIWMKITTLPFYPSPHHFSASDYLFPPTVSYYCPGSLERHVLSSKD